MTSDRRTTYAEQKDHPCREGWMPCIPRTNNESRRFCVLSSRMRRYSRLKLQ